jgi:nucleotide-binding universal stress UspA family protein
MKRILVPVDFSEDSVFALDVAVETANYLKANLRLMHVRTGRRYHPPFAESNPDLLLADVDSSYMEYLITRAKEKYSVQGGVLDFKIREGNVVREISNQAHYDDSSLIVVGTHGISGFEDRWVGSNAYRLVANAPCPVLTVRCEMKMKQDQKVLIVIDSEKVSRRIVPQVAGFATLLKAKILVVGVNSQSRWLIPGIINSYVHQVERYIKKNSTLQVETMILDRSKNARDLLEYAHQQHVTFIALPVRKTLNPFESLFHPYANELLNLSDVPVLVIPESE